MWIDIHRAVRVALTAFTLTHQLSFIVPASAETQVGASNDACRFHAQRGRSSSPAGRPLCGEMTYRRSP